MATESSAEITLQLRGRSKAEYGPDYDSHVLEIYKIYVEMADRISARRQTANSFFLSINTAIVALGSYVHLGEEQVDIGRSFFWLVAVAGIILCYLWYRLVRSYKDMNSGKFKVVHEIEKELPLRPYDAEWTALGRGEKPEVYLPFTKIEARVPWVFGAVHVVVLTRSIPWSSIIPC